MSPGDWERLYSFKGFGNPAGKFWFIGIEERGEGIPEELQVRLKYREIEDLLYSQSPEVWGHSHLWQDFNPDRLIPTWTIMIRLVLRLSGDPDWRDSETVRQYQREHLGKLDGETFLTDLLPLPKPSDASWPSFWPFPNWDAYADEILPGRLHMLHESIRSNSPTYVFCYGKWYWPKFKELFPRASFEPLLSGRFEVARTNGTTVALTPFFSPRTGMTITQIDGLAAALTSC